VRSVSPDRGRRRGHDSGYGSDGSETSSIFHVESNGRKHKLLKLAKELYENEVTLTKAKEHRSRIQTILDEWVEENYSKRYTHDNKATGSRLTPEKFNDMCLDLRQGKDKIETKDVKRKLEQLDITLNKWVESIHKKQNTRRSYSRTRDDDDTRSLISRSSMSTTSDEKDKVEKVLKKHVKDMNTDRHPNLNPERLDDIQREGNKVFTDLYDTAKDGIYERGLEQRKRAEELAKKSEELAKKSKQNLAIKDPSIKEPAKAPSERVGNILGWWAGFLNPVWYLGGLEAMGKGFYESLVGQEKLALAKERMREMLPR